MIETPMGAPGMGSGSGHDPPLRRDRAIELLCEAFAMDQIGTAELERRLDRANRAHTQGELQSLLADLDLAALQGSPPAVREGDGSGGGVSERSEAVAHSTSGVGSAVARVSRNRVPNRQVSVGIWSGRVRKGSWIPARDMTAIAVMGGVELDFREAVFGPDPVNLRIAAVMGGVHVIVPPHVSVETSGFAFMGGFEDYGEVEASIRSDAPTLRVRGFAVMGGVEIEMRRIGESSRDARRRRRREGRG